MATLKKNAAFFETKEGLEIVHALKQMMRDSAYNTESSYSINITKYPDNRMPFADKHMSYIITHPSIDPQQYLANLRMMTLIR